MAAGLGGDFVVAWRSDGAPAGGDASGTSIAGRRFDAGGLPLGGQLQVNDFTTGAQASPDLAFATDGGFVVVWRSVGSTGDDADGASIALRAFDAGGTPRGGQQQLNVHTAGTQESPALCRQDDGFAVIWQGDTTDDADASGIAGRRAGATGDPLGDEFQVNELTTGAQRRPAVAAQPGGGFVVAWTTFGTAGDPDDAVAGRFFAADGRPLRPELQVNTYTTEAQYGPSVAGEGADFVVVWTSFGSASGDADYAVAGRRYGGRIFADGFESGDTGAW